MASLERFVLAQRKDYDRALKELNKGRKVGHWIWYIFPQLKTLGYSQFSKFFGISGIEEAHAYMNHPILGPRYLQCVAALLKHQHQPIDFIMGGAVDAKKLKSSLTLMLSAGGGPDVLKALNVFFGDTVCEDTLRELEEPSPSSEGPFGR